MLVSKSTNVMNAGKLASAHGSLWVRASFQLLVGLLLAVFVPWLVRVILEPSQIAFVGLTASLIGTFLALTSGFVVFSRLSIYPGVTALKYMIPTFLITYGVILGGFFFLRIDYSRLQFIVSFLLCIGWILLVNLKLRHLTPLRIGVVPCGQIEPVLAISGVDWQLLSTQDFTGHLDAITADLRADIPNTWERYLADRAIEGKLVLHVKQLQESLTGRVTIEHLSENNLGSLMPGLIYGKAKRLIDLVSALLAMLLLLPMFVVIGVLIRLSSRGPVLFLQERMGYRGKPFMILKFRTMRSAAKPMDARAAAMTTAGDQRVTKVGRILRRFRLDELPQVINIFKGEMSWIGPRPEALPLSIWYEAELPFYRYRHIVRPGISGWAQVNQGHVTDMADVFGKLSYDFYYIKNFSIWMDILIVLKTFRTVLTGFGVR